MTQKSRRPRDSVFMMAWVASAPQAEPRRYLMRNLSDTGCCIAEPHALDKFERMIVSIGQEEHVPAEVAWIREGTAGLQFLRPIDLRLARRRRGDGPIAGPKAGWLSDQRRPHQRVYG